MSPGCPRSPDCLSHRLAQRLRRLVEERSGVELALGQLDITFHRDDVHVRGGHAPRRPQPLVRDTKLDFELEGRTVVRRAIDSLLAACSVCSVACRMGPA